MPHRNIEKLKLAENFPEAHRKASEVLSAAEIERQMQLDVANAFLKKQEAGGATRRDILKHYFDRYKDILDNELVDPLNTEERYKLLLELIYKHEITEKEKSGIDAKKAA